MLVDVAWFIAAPKETNGQRVEHLLLIERDAVLLGARRPAPFRTIVGASARRWLSKAFSERSANFVRQRVNRRGRVVDLIDDGQSHDVVAMQTHPPMMVVVLVVRRIKILVEWPDDLPRPVPHQHTRPR